MNPDGSDVQTLTLDGAGPAWSPTGNRLAFNSSVDGTNAIYVINADGSGRTEFTFTVDPVGVTSPSWSPDGSKILFTREGFNLGDLPDIYMMNTGGTGVTNLTNSPGRADVTAVWSPDGTRIAFISRGNDENAEVYVMNADGSGQTNISHSAASEFHLDWQPTPSTTPNVRGQVDQLIASVSQLVTQKSIQNSLTASLNDVLTALDANDTVGACSALTDFTRKVRAQSGKKISESAATSLLTQAAAIADALGCNGS